LSQLTSLGIAKLRSLSSLHSLDLTGCIQITDEALTALQPLSSLASLKLLGCFRIGDEGLAALCSLRGLRDLDVCCCHQLSHRGLAALGQLPALSSLTLRGCDGINDAAACVLGKRMMSLSSLDLGYCQRLTNAGLAALQSLSHLKELNLENCDSISQHAVEHFKIQLPSCTISGYDII